MRQVIIESFGGVERLKLHDAPTPEPGPGEVLVRLTSIGMNHAELMARRGEYKASSGAPPFTPGLEGGGVIDAVGEGVDASRLGRRVILTPDAPRVRRGVEGGTYRTHLVVKDGEAMAAPDGVPDEQIGALWLAFLTVWGCLVWKDPIHEGDIVALPAASSSVALAASQIVKRRGGVTIGLTSSPEKVEAIGRLKSARYDHLLVTHEADGTMRDWQPQIKHITDGHRVDVFFDPVAAGDYLQAEVRGLASGGRIWVYGLLGKPGVVDLSPLIIRRASIRGWMLSELIDAGPEHWRPACEAILDGFADGTFVQDIGGRFALDDVRRAHAEMEKSEHLGKLLLLP